ncbi:MAG: Uncharacterized protein FD189_1388 [Elusimicrobia bacterium]|nr:MAG: Uncharacterized protein FD154_1415 [Elusimicrobiota bacterium]KAF0155472.1 MAG: Uncharacterized protein FD189_1388 [Elusimicrobiota bacterium]
MKKSTKAISTGVGIAALAALGAYFLTGKRGEKNRELIAGWTLKMKGEVLEKAEKLKELNKEAYEKIVDDVTRRYERVGRAGAAELKNIKSELKDAWRHVGKAALK